MNANDRPFPLAKWSGLAVAVLLLLACCNYLSPFNKSAFDAAVWHRPHEDEDRCGMIDDLRATVLRRGKDIGQVKALLGEPDTNRDRDRIASYFLGFCSTSVDPDTLDIAYDADGKITSVDIITH